MIRAAAIWALCAGCTWELHRMNDQPRCDPYEGTTLLADGECMQAPPVGAVPSATTPAPALPQGGPTRDRILRGADRYARFCAPCHGPLGDGRSQVAENMSMRPPPSLHDPVIVGYPDQRLWDVITGGYGLMRPYADELPPEDRQAVIEFVRVLQRSQDVALDELPPALQQEALRWLP